VTRRRLVLGTAITSAVAALAGCLPLPPTIAAALCAPASTYVPASTSSAPMVPLDAKPGAPLVPAPNAELLARLATFDGTFRASADPVVTVRLPDASARSRQTAAALRQEFGSAIDIEMGMKRLGGGPSGATSACLLVLPRWALGDLAPRGVRVDVEPTALVFGRNDLVTATVTVTNRTRRTVRVAKLIGTLGRGCGAPVLGEALASPNDAVSMNVAKGEVARGVVEPASPVGGQSLARIPGTPADRAWYPASTACQLLGTISTTLPPGKRVAFEVTATTTSLVPGDDPVLAAGTYDLRVTVAIDATTRTTDRVFLSTLGLPPGFRVVSTPPTRIILRDDVL